MNALHFLGTAGALVTIGDLALAHWARAGPILFGLLGVAFNIGGILLYAHTLQMESVGVATAVFLGINILAVTLGGIFLFGEQLSAARIVGLFVLTVALVFVEIVG